jgi:ribosomal protein S27E
VGDWYIQMNFFEKLRIKFSEFMYGRNGYDRLAIWSLTGGLILWAVAIIFQNSIVNFISFLLCLYSLFRCYSKNITARAHENEKFEQLIKNPSDTFANAKMHWVNRKTTKYFKCKNCGQSLSVPKGKGTLKVTCPKCHTQTIIKS